VNLRALCGAASAFAWLCFAEPAHADQEAILLEYEVGTGCPDRAQFIERVHTFTSKAEIARDDGTPRRKFAVRISGNAGKVQGELTIDDHGAKSTRDVAGTGCDEVISALALATALAVDPDALGGATVDETRERGASAPAPSTAKTAPALAPLAPDSRSLRPPSASARAHAPWLSLSAGARLGSAMAPFPKLEASAELGFSYLSPFELYLGSAYGPPQHDRLLELSDWLGWLGVGYRTLEREPFSVSLLAALELGDVQASGGSDVSPRRHLHRLWAALNAGVALRETGPGPLFFQANLGARVPLSLQRYVETSNQGAAELYQVERLGYLLGLSAGVHFL
jgi:hypothetical protein